MKNSYIIANRTDVGRVRDVNEDCMVTFDSPNGRVIAVCDGMGGQAAGDVASRLACDIITDIITNNTFNSPTETITRACMAANQGIVHTAAQNPELEGMGATCVIVIIKDGLVYYGWVGDSRIYYISHGTIRQLSRDQSFVQQLVDQGKITAEEAETHPQKNQILNALGLSTMTPPELCPAPLSPEDGSVILLCSDGLSGMVDNQTIASIISNPEQTLQRKADILVEQACANGGNDNITVQLVQFNQTKAGSSVKKNPFIFYCICAIIIAVIAFAAIFLFSNKKTPEKLPTPGPEIKEKIVSEPIKVESPKTVQKQETKVKEVKEKKSTPPQFGSKENGKAKTTGKGKGKSSEQIIRSQTPSTTPEGFNEAPKLEEK